VALLKWIDRLNVPPRPRTQFHISRKHKCLANFEENESRKETTIHIRTFYSTIGSQPKYLQHEVSPPLAPPCIFCFNNKMALYGFREQVAPPNVLTRDSNSFKDNSQSLGSPNHHGSVTPVFCDRRQPSAHQFLARDDPDFLSYSQYSFLI
jgi:hypothetical protein